MALERMAFWGSTLPLDCSKRGAGLGDPALPQEEPRQ